ncbi:Coiled-coil domain-containing protein 111-like protein [Morus notabilis]|uniref:DNA-directed primase/polymerase protein n=1 Tax=Morus notabilis TaxID=981085 RepID=W9S0B4_9ROSA|nr:Coiled-coil domain-containing protein 111-like protein [Morus notabilis]
MDDIDRLFECFKCGISPPESAVRERKRSRSKLKQASSSHDVSAESEILSPGSAARKHEKTANIQPSLDKSGSKTVKANNFNSGKQISPVVFYGSPQGVPPKRPSRLLLRLLYEIRADLTEQSKSSLSEEIWSTFPRQDEAMKFAKGHENARVFSYQDHYNGQRRYKNVDSKFRHHYEVIQEGLPCHLYFDLEFSRRENAERDGDEMVDLLISVILEALHDKYSIQGNHEWILELDSSTDVKFSRHLIIRIPKSAFKDNSHAGAFVNEICSRIINGREKNGQFEKLFVRKESTSVDSPGQLFVDTAVYSRNRCFRLALSSKAGKSSVLLPTGRYKAKDMCEDEMFMASLICNMDVDCDKLLVCKMDVLCMKTLQFDTEVNHSSGRRYCSPQELTLDGCRVDASTTYFMGKSPFPALDAFIESVASIGNTPGKIRSWYLFSEYGLMVYSMSRNRYCERIGREHKSYRSPLRPIPWDIIPETVHHEGSGVHNLEQYNDENTANSSTPDSWWLEAMRFADNVERMPDLSELSKMENISDEDENWWLAVERAVSQTELSHDCGVQSPPLVRKQLHMQVMPYLAPRVRPC